MKAGDIIYNKLTSTAGVTAIVSTRVFPVDAPLEVDLPCCWYDVQLTEHVDGSAPMSTAQIQVGCAAHTEAGVHDLASVVDAALEGMTAYRSGTWLRCATRTARSESKDPENNLWGVLLVYSASVTF